MGSALARRVRCPPADKQSDQTASPRLNPAFVAPMREAERPTVRPLRGKAGHDYITASR